MPSDLANCQDNKGPKHWQQNTVHNKFGNES
jgi:hypothetical protein